MRRDGQREGEASTRGSRAYVEKAVKARRSFRAWQPWRQFMRKVETIHAEA